MLKTLVKVGSLSNLSDARYCAGMGVNLLGFDFNTSSPDYVTPAQFKEITGWLSGVHTVGECNNLTVSEIDVILQECKVDFLEINSFQQGLSETGVPLIYRVFWHENEPLAGLKELLETHSPAVSYFLLETSAEMLSQAKLLELKQLSKQYKIILGLNSNTLTRMVAETEVTGIALRSHREEKTGYTNADALAELLELLEMD